MTHLVYANHTWWLDVSAPSDPSEWKPITETSVRADIRTRYGVKHEDDVYHILKSELCDNSFSPKTTISFYWERDDLPSQNSNESVDDWASRWNEWVSQFVPADDIEQN